MPYPKRLLNPGEEVALDLRPHWWFFWKHIVSGIALFVLLIVIWRTLHGTVETVALWPWAVVALVWAVWLAMKYLDWNFTHFVVTSDRVVFRTGVLAKRGVEIPMERINNINFRQSIWERVIGAGDLAIESAGKDGQSTFADTWHPDGVQQEIYRQMEANARKRATWSGPPVVGTATPAPPTLPNIPEQIRQLAELRDRGLISAHEYESKKAQLLERM